MGNAGFPSPAGARVSHAVDPYIGREKRMARGNSDVSKGKKRQELILPGLVRGEKKKKKKPQFRFIETSDWRRRKVRQRSHNKGTRVRKDAQLQGKIHSLWRF